MARLVNAVALGLIAAGASYAVHGSDAERWLIERGATLARAAAEGREPTRAPQNAASDDKAPIAGDRKLRVLAVRSEPETDVEPPPRLRFAAPPAELQIPVPTAAARPEPAELPPAAIVRMAEAGAARPGAGGNAVTQATGEDPKQRLVRSIQIELARVGCYAGTIDGDWSTDTRKAMKAFNDRVNATLPIAQPDYILLTLLQGHAAKACGTLCPAGQAEAENGACLPRSVLAESRRRSAVAAGSTYPTAGAAASGLASVGAPSRPRESEPDRKAANARSESEAEVLAQRKAAADKAVAEAERARLETEALARRNKAAADKALAAAEADKARLRAQEERQRQQAAEAAERAETERRRIAAAEERKRRLAAEAEARAEAERLARLAEAERSRVAAETRRRDEIAALAAREARAARTAVEPAPPATAAPRALPPVTVDSAAGRAVPTAPEIAAPVERPAPDERVVVPKAIPKPPDARFVGRFVPPPTFRVGRLPPSPQPRAAAPVRVSPAAPRATSAPPRGIFRHLQHHSP